MMPDRGGERLPRKILVVDDNDLSRLLLHDILSHDGFTVLVAENGAEGVKTAWEERPDLILMDLQMPVMNGLEAGKLLRSDPRSQGVRILALSSFNLLEDRDDFFATGFDGYISKPFDIKELLKTVRKYLSDGVDA
jgi:two-component system cell cycle response regulator DivK